MGKENDNIKSDYYWRQKYTPFLLLIFLIILVINGTLILLFTLVVFNYSLNVVIIGSTSFFMGIILIILDIYLKKSKTKMVIDIPKQKNIEKKVDNIIKKALNEIITDSITMRIDKLEAGEIFIVKIDDKNKLTIWSSYTQSIEVSNYSIAIYGINKNNLYLTKIIQTKLSNELHNQKLI